MNKIENYKLVNPNEFEEHPIRKKVFLEETSQCLDAYKESKEKVGKILPVIYIEKGPKKLVIDGWKHVQQAIENNEECVLALKIDPKEEDISQLLVELHRNYHLSIKEEHKMCAYLFDNIKLQKGFRSDVKESENLEEQDNEVELVNSQEGKKKRRPVVYDKIAEIMGISANRVKHLLKVGKVNPWYFDRIEKDRTSLYAAYSKCKEEERGIEQTAPGEREIVYVTTTTPKPEFGLESKTIDVPFVYTQEDTKPQAEITKETIGESGSTSKLIYTIQKLVCPHCGEAFEFIIPKSNES